MALTDSRTGFRLPWSTDRSASREATEPAEPVEPAESAEAAPIAAEPAANDAAASAVDAGPATPTPQDAPGDAVRSDEEDPVSIVAPRAAPTTIQPERGATRFDAGAPTHDPAKKPSKFLADLTKAMQAAAEQARAATLEQFHAEGTAVIEQVHARSAETATELRRRTDADVVAIKDWSKAEIARIREETERRISARRGQLEGQLERHAALVEEHIEWVQARIAAFEATMGRFFDDLRLEDDPGEFAARAASLPEPPVIRLPDEDDLTALLAEPGLGVPASEPEPVAAAVEDSAVTAAVMEPAVVEAVVVEPTAERTGDDAPNPWADVTWGQPSPEASGDATATPGHADPFDRETAMAAIQAAAEAAAAMEAAEAQADRAEAAADRAEAIVGDADPANMEIPDAAQSWIFGEAAPAEAEADPEPVEAGEPESLAEADATETTEPTAEAEAPEAEAFAPAPEPEHELDPRLAMLGLTPDFEAAEMAAAEAAAAEADEAAMIGGDLLAARLSGLVPDGEPAEPVETVSTQVVTTGLVSVASIASFKRHLGRLAGVSHVGVSSGPDGEFVFAVTHEATTALRDLIPTVPGFAARVVSSGDGVLQVSAQDPQD